MYTDYARWPDLVFLNAFAGFSGSFKRESDDHAEEVWLDTVFTVGQLSREVETVLLGHFREGSQRPLKTVTSLLVTMLGDGTFIITAPTIRR